MTKSLKLEINHEWEDLDYKNHKKFKNEPAIYKWNFWIDGRLFVYIGETVNLKNRISHYMKPGLSQKTNQLLNKNYIKKSNKILLQKIKINKFIIDKNNILKKSNQDILLTNIYYRKLIENLLLTITDEKIINSTGRMKNEPRRT